MKKQNLFLCALILFVFAGCKNPTQSEEDLTETSKITSYDKYDAPITKAEIIKEVSEDGFRKIIFDYPSTDVENNSVRVSGIICIDLDFYNSDEKHADYTILVNHGATPKWDDCPSRNGGKELCGYLSGLESSGENVIGIAPDYLGLGSSKNELQAFVFGDVNARASLDALIWGRTLLKDKGFSWEDKVANIGYSQGGQTAICVQKLVDTEETYSDITITKTFAGDGVYNIRTMIEESLKNETPILPSVIFLGTASYNWILKLGFDESKIFKDPDLIEECIMSKKYNLQDSMTKLVTALYLKTKDTNILMNYRDWSLYLTDDMLDTNSDLYNDILSAVEPYTNYWTPKPTTKIVLFTADNDDIVPSKNSDNLFEYFKHIDGSEWENTEAITNIDTDFSADNIYIRYHEEGESSLTNIIHQKGGERFSSKVVTELIAHW